MLSILAVSAARDEIQNFTRLVLPTVDVFETSKEYFIRLGFIIHHTITNEKLKRIVSPVLI